MTVKSQSDTEEHFVPASFNHAVPSSLRSFSKPIRLSFEPWGRRRVGTPDPDAPGYQILDGTVYYTAQGIASGNKIVYVEDVSGRKFVVADGKYFKPEGLEDLPADIRASLTMEEYSPVIGFKTDSGYIPVGINVVLFKPT